MKVLFLDIDGVLNCKHTDNPRHLPYMVDSALLARLQRVLDATGAVVVLSSTWRYDPAGLFSARRYGIPYIDVTPDLPQQPRRNEITEWLAKHPQVTRFAVLDDEDDELDELPLFQPSPRTGLTDRVAGRLTAYLNGETERDCRDNRAKRLLQNMASWFRGHRG